VQVLHLAEERVVATGALCAALDDMPGHHARRQLVPVVARPAKAPRSGAQGERRVGDARADHQVGPAFERGGDPPAAQVGVGGEHRLLEGTQRDALVEVGQWLAVGLELLEPGQQVVALQVRHRGADAEFCVEGARRLRAAGRVEPPGVHHDLDAPLRAAGGHLLELAQKSARVAQLRISQAVLEQDHQRELGEVVAGQHVDGAALDHLARGAQAVAVEAAAVGDAQRVAHRPPASRTWAWSAIGTASLTDLSLVSLRLGNPTAVTRRRPARSARCRGRPSAPPPRALPSPQPARRRRAGAPSSWPRAPAVHCPARRGRRRRP